MKTPLPAEVKAKISALYWKQKVLLVTNEQLEFVNSGWNLTHPDFKLLLTPLSDITDEHYIGVAECYDYDANLTTHSKSGAIIQGRNIITIYKNSSIRLNMEAADYLRSLSYALPFTTSINGKPVTYSVEELVEAGIIKLITKNK